MKNIFLTNGTNITALIARLALAIVIFPHGAQKLLGWFGGYGFEGTMDFLTGSAGLSWTVALLVILIEFFSPLLLILGAATRLASLSILGNFLGIVLTSHLHNGFFMNWYGVSNQGEGLEYFILLLGLVLITLLAGGGRASVDYILSEKAG